MQDSDFFHWWRECSLAFQSVETAPELLLVQQKQSVLMGFEFCAFCLRHPIPFTRQNLLTLATNYPEQWMAGQHMEHIAACDVILKEQPGSRCFLSWHDAHVPRGAGDVHQGFTQGGGGI
ncbi:Regulatory protein SdiA [Shimwellia blattae]|nr:Regulatory protein SdiA [Shimwellia blattae]